ncbi:hypothetical protein FRC15_000564 [Serendipita sp. 397]|nr:hypothetical protein FRC15_000564 [Serendipita sp. 397]
MHVHETLRRNPKRTTVQKSTKTRIGLRDPKNATASTSTVPLPTNRQKDPVIPASIPQNLHQPVDWDSERRKLDRHHRSWLDHYAGNTTEANHEVLRRIVHHIQTYGTPPMEVFVKVDSKSGVEKVTCDVCRAKCLEGLISSNEIREFPTVQKAASHITSEHWQLQLWSCPDGCGKSFRYRNSIKDPRSHSGECKLAATPSGVIVSVVGARDPPVSTRHSDHSTRVSLPGALYKYSSNPTVPQNHQADHKEEGMNEDKFEMLEDTDTSGDVGVPITTHSLGDSSNLSIALARHDRSVKNISHDDIQSFFSWPPDIFIDVSSRKSSPTTPPRLPQADSSSRGLRLTGEKKELSDIN